ncbi:hypothetical protein ScalyP_jg3806 [Parmales sp. scaly parma]|nr:hypothetical protein ScalyP_jg3806 [Parmales sp. scaly parma]
MVQFADLAKSVKDLINEDYTSKVTCKIKTKAAGVAITNETTRVDGGALSSKISAKFAGPSGFAVDKFQLLENGGHKVETSLVGVVDGLKFTFKGNLDKDAGDLGVEYNKGKTFFTGDMDVIKLTKMNASVCTSMGAISLGGKAGYSFGKNTLTSYDVGASYSAGKLFAALQSGDKLGNANMSLHYAVNSDLKVASMSSHSAAEPLGNVWLGCSYAAPVGQIKAKVCSDGLVHACLIKKVASGVSITPSLQLAANNIGSLKWGLGCQLG